MSVSADYMELREEDIRKHYAAALALLDGFDHAPRIGQVREVVTERSPGVSTGVSTGRRFRSTTPGLSTRRTVRAGSVQLRATIEAADAQDILTSPVEAVVLCALRRALAIALAIGEAFGERTELAQMKRANAQGHVGAGKSAAFGQLLAAEALCVGFVFASALSSLLADHAGEGQVEIGDVDEILSENAPLMLHGLLWELDQDIAAHGTDDGTLVATVLGFAESVMTKLEARASTAPGLEGFLGTGWRVEADDFVVDGFSPARKAKGTKLTMSFKKPHEVVGNHIAKYQAMKLAKMVMA